MDLLFIFILIFIAMTIFNAIGNNAQRKKENEQREQRSRPGSGPPANRPSREQDGNEQDGGLFGELRKQFDDMMNEEDHPTQRAPRSEREVYREENTKTSDDPREYERERERLRRESREAKKRLENTEVPPVAVTKNRQRQTLPFGDLSGNDVVKGVIWSEVLDEPKSRRPHKTNRMMK